MGEIADVIVLGEDDNRGSILRWLKFIAGGEFGKGKRGGGVSSLLVGVLDDREPVGENGPKWVAVADRPSLSNVFTFFRYSTFVWIGSGLSFADFVWIRSKPWKEFDPRDPPAFLQTVIKTNNDKPDVYLEPKEYSPFPPSWIEKNIA
jgi:DNA ligase-4